MNERMKGKMKGWMNEWMNEMFGTKMSMFKVIIFSISSCYKLCKKNKREEWIADGKVRNEWAEEWIADGKVRNEWTEEWIADGKVRNE